MVVTQSISVVLLCDQDSGQLTPCYEQFVLTGDRARRLLLILQEGESGDAPSPHCFINRGDSALDQRRLPSDRLALQRFEFELRVIALLVGPLYCLLDAVRSIARVWPRYFGRAPLPRGYGTKIFPKLLEVAKQRRLFRDYSHEYARDCHYSMADLALYELVAMIMYKEWFHLRRMCPVPFEYPDLVRTRLPPGGAQYRARYPFQSKYLSDISPWVFLCRSLK